MKKLSFVFFAFVTISSSAQSTTTAITPDGQQLIKRIDSSHVNSLWQSGYLVNWLTGVSLSKSTSSTDTHCSAFVASFADRLGIYILRPPEHVQLELANAQCIWLATDTAAQFGWQKVATQLEAQNAADSGYLVVVGYQNPVPTSHGHIAVIRPYVKTLTLLKNEGPQDAQAGNTNYFSIPVKQGFSSHPGAFPNGVIYYRHNVNWDSLTLPVSLNNLDVTIKRNNIKVSWQTATELNTSHFIIQHSTTGTSFTDIGNVKAIGSGANGYQFMDTHPANGTNYYRLQSVDKDGSASYSKVVSVQFIVNSNQLTVFPNPARDNITISCSHVASVQVIDNMGKVVKTVALHDANNPSVSVGSLPKGMYHFRIEMMDGSVSSKTIMVSY